MKSINEEMRVVSSLKKRYILALSLIALLLLFSQIAVQYIINQQVNDSHIINIAGRQRMLSQKINKAAFGYYLSSTSSAKQEYLEELKESRNLWETSHSELVGQHIRKNSKEIEKLYSDIEGHYDAILAATDEIIKSSEDGLPNNEMLYSQIKEISENERAFLAGMDAIVFQYDAEAYSRVKALKSAEMLLLLAALILLILVGLLIFRPISKKIQEAYVEISENRRDLLKLFEAAPTAMLLVEGTGEDVLQMNQYARQLLGLKESSVEKLTINRLIIDSHESGQQVLNRIRRGETIAGEETVLVTADAVEKPILISSCQIKFNDRMVNVLGISDLSRQKEAEAILRRYATTDEMTGLLNKRSGQHSLEKRISRAKMEVYDFSVCFMDIDGLKAVNDQYGHEEGDWYITNVAKSIQGNLRLGDVAYRYGGDEIVLILEDCDAAEALKVVQRIEETVLKLKQDHEKPYMIGISYGVANYGSLRFDTVEEVVSQVDKLMYEQKMYKKAHNYEVISR